MTGLVSFGITPNVDDILHTVCRYDPEDKITGPKIKACFDTLDQNKFNDFYLAECQGNVACDIDIGVVVDKVTGRAECLDDSANFFAQVYCE